jgi:hypothetical protein
MFVYQRTRRGGGGPSGGRGGAGGGGRGGGGGGDGVGPGGPQRSTFFVKMARPSPGTAPFHTDPCAELHLKLHPIKPCLPITDVGPFHDTAAHAVVFAHHSAQRSSVLEQSSAPEALRSW